MNPMLFVINTGNKIWPNEKFKKNIKIQLQFNKKKTWQMAVYNSLKGANKAWHDSI